MHLGHIAEDPPQHIDRVRRAPEEQILRNFCSPTAQGSNIAEVVHVVCQRDNAPAEIPVVVEALAGSKLRVEPHGLTHEELDPSFANKRYDAFQRVHEAFSAGLAHHRLRTHDVLSCR